LLFPATGILLPTVDPTEVLIIHLIGLSGPFFHLLLSFSVRLCKKIKTAGVLFENAEKGTVGASFEASLERNRLKK
jgi:hypothetical protein